MTATTAARTSLTITPDTNPEPLIGQHILLTIAAGNGQPLTLAGRFESVQRMNFGRGVTGIGGTFVSDDRPKPGDTGRTGMFVPDGTTVFLAR